MHIATDSIHNRIIFT